MFEDYLRPLTNQGLNHPFCTTFPQTRKPQGLGRVKARTASTNPPLGRQVQHEQPHRRPFPNAFALSQ
ncbi:MAG: hypothetical protein CM15mP120_19960 [Pseudomonadota bacterium]|nr:MAG: hypothetical protein CM15mP120_19960 [Pseudomonadota bacterium]